MPRRPVRRLRTAVQRPLPPVRDDRRDADEELIRGVIVVLVFALIGAVLATVITRAPTAATAQPRARGVRQLLVRDPRRGREGGRRQVGPSRRSGSPATTRPRSRSIDDPRFEPFRADAHCEMGSIPLGEQFVQCTPSQPVAAGAQRAPVCRRSHPAPTRATRARSPEHDHTGRPRSVRRHHAPAAAAAPADHHLRARRGPCRQRTRANAALLRADRRCSRPTRRSPCCRARTGCWPD